MVTNEPSAPAFEKCTTIPRWALNSDTDSVDSLDLVSFEDDSSVGTSPSIQDAVDRVFSSESASLLDLEFPFIIADPDMHDCPFLGCSKGFTEMTGYPSEEMVGQNWRFLADSVPAEVLDEAMREQTSEFCRAVANNQEYRRPADLDYPWMPEARPCGEFIAMQANVRKDGTIFYCLSRMKVFHLSLEVGDGKPYIIELHSELRNGPQDMEKIVQSLDELAAKMTQLTSMLAEMFFMTTAVDFHELKDNTKKFGI